jgi:uncharacterized protein (DUF2147 family)
MCLGCALEGSVRYLSLVVALCLSLPFGAALAQSASPEGTWRDKYGTIFEISLCGNGTDLCAILKDVQGEARNDKNLAYVGKQVLQASQTAQHEWQGTVIYNGSEAQATVTEDGPDVLSIKGCRGIFCDTLVFSRV